MHYKIMHLRFVSTNIHALTPTSVYEFGSRHRNGVDNIPNFHTALTHCTQLPHMLQNSYNALTLYSKLPHDIQSPPAHYTKLTHIIPHILQGIDILFEAHRILQVFHGLFFCAISIHRRYETRKSYADGTNERPPRPRAYRMSSTTVE